MMMRCVIKNHIILQKYREKVFLEITRNDKRIFSIIALFTTSYFIGNYASFVAVSGHAIPIALTLD